jgi:hypothetical protein
MVAVVLFRIGAGEILYRVSNGYVVTVCCRVMVMVSQCVAAVLFRLRAGEVFAK